MRFRPWDWAAQVSNARANGVIARASAVLGLACGLGFSGCGTPGAPQPPSLKLPNPVQDLSAVREGGTVTLRWTSPRKTTDHLQIAGNVAARVCRQEVRGVCQKAGEVNVVAGGKGEFRETLPGELQAGEARELPYSVELLNRVGRSAGFSNVATVVAGAEPAPIEGLTAEARADGVALHWRQGGATAVRLHRVLVSAPARKKNTDAGPMSAPAEPVLQDLMVDWPTIGGAAPSNGALDGSARFGEVYEYTAQPVAQVTLSGRRMELGGEISAPVRVDVADRFPPAVPGELVAVAVDDEKESAKPGRMAVDLSWRADTEDDLAGYIVYRGGESDARNSDGIQAGKWVRISGAQPVVGPAYRDMSVDRGHGYRYSVSAIDSTGNESGRSAETTVSVPEP